MNVIIGSARIDENGKAHGGKAGDQTGKEVSTQNFYNNSKGWYVLRPIDVEHAQKIAKAMSDACKNKHIGYDQYERNGVIAWLKNGYKIAEIDENTECDCSSLVRACIYEATRKDVGDIYTGNLADALEKSGLFHDRKSVSFPIECYNGDVLVTKTKGHTAIVISGHARETMFYPLYSGKSYYIDEVFTAIGADVDYDTKCSGYRRRLPIAKANGYEDYTGTYAQNMRLIAKAKNGTLKKVTK